MPRCQRNFEQNFNITSSKIWAFPIFQNVTKSNIDFPEIQDNYLQIKLRLNLKDHIWHTSHHITIYISQNYTIKHQHF